MSFRELFCPAVSDVVFVLCLRFDRIHNAGGVDETCARIHSDCSPERFVDFLARRACFKRGASTCTTMRPSQRGETATAKAINSLILEP